MFLPICIKDLIFLLSYLFGVYLTILGCSGCIGVSWMCVQCRGRYFLQTTLKGHGSPVTHTMEWPLPSSSLLIIQDWVKYHFFHDTLSSAPFPDLLFYFLQLMAVLDSLLFSAVNSWKSPTTASSNIVGKQSPDPPPLGHISPSPS